MKRIVFCLQLAVLMMPLREAVAQNYTWKQKASLPGLSRWGAYHFVIGNYGYIGGGYHNGNLNDLWQYNPVNNSWTQKSSCPIATRTAGCFSINGFGYVVGGIIPPGYTLTNQMYQYNPVTNSWTQKSNHPGTPVYGAASFALGGKGYYGIGNGGSATGPYYKNFYEYDPVNDQWNQKALFPGQGRYGTLGVASNNFGYVGFGANESSNTYFSDWYQYNPITDTWVQKQNFPNALSYPSSFYINNKIYVGLGYYPNILFNDFFSYDEGSNSWTAEPSFPGNSRWVAIGFAIQGKGYAGTGMGLSLNNSYTDFFEFSPAVPDSIVCVTLKPDSINGRDVNIYSIAPNQNFDPNPELLVSAWTCQGSSCITRTLIEFDNSIIPVNATLISSYLKLFFKPNPVSMPAPVYGNGNAFLIRRIVSPWSEDSVTWNSQPASTSQNEILMPPSLTTGPGYLDIDVTALVTDMRNDPQNSFGFMLRLVNEIPYNSLVFSSSDDSDTSLWPSITFCYTIPVNVSHPAGHSNFVKLNSPIFNETIKLNFQISSDKYRIDIFDITGKMVFNKHFTCQPNMLQTVEIHQGELKALSSNAVYFLRFNSSGLVETKRLIKIKY